VTPDKLEAGTYVYENVAGMDAAIGYLEDLGRRFLNGGREAALKGCATTTADASRVEAIRAAMTAIADYERTLSARLLDVASSVPGVTVHGITARDQLADRIPTLCFSVAGRPAAAIADALAARDIGVRSGHMYSPRLMARLGLPPTGAVRASLVHYNTVAEIDRFGDALREVIEAPHEC
jgi:selenocysteine lyase/cysteine desulfurase